VAITNDIIKVLVYIKKRYFQFEVILMIRIKLSELLGKNKMTRKALAELVGVRPNTIGDLYNERVRKIDLKLINNICKELNCELTDLIEYTRD